MKKCHSCGREMNDNDFFCAKCGAALDFIAVLPYVGESITRALYCVTFAPVEAEFDSKEAAQEAARHSAWNEDREFPSFTVEKVKTTVPVTEYPFICGSCHRIVSDTKEGRCDGCSATNWKDRHEHDA